MAILYTSGQSHFCKYFNDTIIKIRQINFSSQIDKDFEKMFGDASQLRSKWIDFVEDNLQTLAEMINEPRARNSLLSLGGDQGRKNSLPC